MNKKQLVEAMKKVVESSSKPKQVPVAGLGNVFVRPLTVEETEIQNQNSADVLVGERFARGIARLICDEEGKRLFDPPTAEDVKLFASLPWESAQLLMSTSRADDAGVDKKGN